MRSYPHKIAFGILDVRFTVCIMLESAMSHELRSSHAITEGPGVYFVLNVCEGNGIASQCA